MDVNDYRRRIEQELDEAVGEQPEVGDAIGALRGGELPARERAAMIDAAPLTPDRFDELIDALLKVLASDAEPVAVRRAALRTLRRAQFLGERFEPWRARLVATVRALLDSDSKLLCSDALETLAAEKDPYAQHTLRRGLTNPADALVSPARAIQLLSYDDHDDAVALVRNMYERLDQSAQESAIQLMASDPESRPLLERLVRDKDQPTQIRQLCATSLQLAAPRDFADIAVEIVEDDDEYPEIQATLIAALSNEPGSYGSQARSLLPRVKLLGNETNSRNLKRTAKRFVMQVGDLDGD